jgi:hypothetical protein
LYKEELHDSYCSNICGVVKWKVLADWACSIHGMEDSSVYHSGDCHLLGYDAV